MNATMFVAPRTTRHVHRWAWKSSLGFWTLLAWSLAAPAMELVFREDFENGWNGWTNDTTYNIDPRFAWVITAPTNGPLAAHTGAACAATLGPGTDCYLVSPPILLPAVNQYSNHLWLFYWQWQKYLPNSASNVCLSDVKIRQLIPGPIGNYWGPWNIIDPGTSGVIADISPAWRRRGIDLTLFSGWPVQLGFGHSGKGDPGWFVDDVEVWNAPVLTHWPGTESFENGWGAWHTDEGAWDLGVPAAGGPTNVPDGKFCAGTGLDGLHPSVVEAHLWTPAFYLPAVRPGERVFLQFDQWHDYSTAFGVAVHWSQWWSSIGWTWPQIIGSDPLLVVQQRTWTPLAVDLTSLAGMPLPMRLGFEHSDLSGIGLGWFIDRVRITVARFQILEIQSQGNDVRLAWAAPAGTTNLVQCSARLGGAFTNLSPALIATGSVESVTTYLHPGAGNGASPRYYRVKRLP